MNHQQSRPFDRLGWPWLAVGASLLPFSMFQTVWPLAAWVSPVFLMRFSRTQQFPFAENRAVLIDPSGTVVWDYHKAHPIPFVESNEYDGAPEMAPYIDTPYGRIAGVICYDTDFVLYMHQAAWAQVGLLLAPANDWPAVNYDHTHEAVYRAVENSFSMMRPDVKGISLAVDPFGRELTTADYFATDRLDVVAMMPVQAVATLHSRIGDVFA